MRKPFVNPAMIELRNAITEAESITAKAEVSKRDEARLNVLLAKIAALRNNQVAPNDADERWARSMFSKNAEQRGTELQAGSQDITFSQPVLGGVLVPAGFEEEIYAAMAAVDPLVNPDNVTWIKAKGDGFNLRPLPVPGWDLSVYKAARIAEGQQQNPQTVPTAATMLMGGSRQATYRASLADTFEFEEDNFDTGLAIAKRAFAVGLARAMGENFTSGAGTIGIPQGVLTGAQDSGLTTAAAATLTYTDFDGLYFSVNEIYRQSDRCAWVMNDTTYKAVRNAVDDQHRPLINVVGDRELLLGKPVLVSPSMPTFGAGAKTIVFGDLSYYIVYASKMRLIRAIEAAGFVEYGKALYTAQMRADGAVFDPSAGASSGAYSPIKYITQHA